MRIKSKIKSLVLLFVAFVLSALCGVMTLNLSVKSASGAGTSSTSAEFGISGLSLRYTDGGAEEADQGSACVKRPPYPP